MESVRRPSAGRQTQCKGNALDVYFAVPGLHREKFVLAIAAGLDHDRAGIELASIYQRHNGAIGGQLLNQGGYILWQTRTAPQRIIVDPENWTTS
jgi:hypothetical protein